MHALEEYGRTPHLLCILQRGEQFATCIFFTWETRAGSTWHGLGMPTRPHHTLLRRKLAVPRAWIQ